MRSGNEHSLPRTQSSLAFRSEDGPWYLVNASPDLRQQLSELPQLPVDGLRATPFAGVLLTDAEIDHTAGLLLMRESSVPLHIYSSEAVRDALTDGYPILRMLERYCGIRWTRLDPGDQVLLEGDIEVESFATGGDPPLYVERDTPDLVSSGLTIRDRSTGGVLTYAPALEAIDQAVTDRFDRSDCVAVDGTFWTDDELVALGLAERNALAMGHMPLSGPDGSLEQLQSLAARTILVHVNNTNPILLDDSAERSLVSARGIDVASDGMEITL